MHLKLRLLPFIIISISVLFTCTACTFINLKKSADKVDALHLIQGKIQNNSGAKGQVYVLLLTATTTSLNVVRYYPVNRDGSYTIYEHQQEYYLLAFVDSSGDGKYQPTEPATFLQYDNALPKKITLSSTTTINLNIADNKLTINVPLEEQIPDSLKIIGNITNLKDDKFSQKYATLGLWQPMTFFEKKLAGLYMLQPYDPNKIPIIFIHGVEGSPTQFSKIIESIDQHRYQPWVLYYPSGFRLDMISNFLLKAMNELQQKYHFSRINIIAHSAGGLVLRSFVQKNHLVKNALKIDTAMTINSPLLGLDSAENGVENSPIVIPVWRDIASNSDFINLLNKRGWPKGTRYYLFFSYLDGYDGDGVVPLTKQLSPRLQEEATKVIGLNAEHTKALEKIELRMQINSVLN